MMKKPGGTDKDSGTIPWIIMPGINRGLCGTGGTMPGSVAHMLIFEAALAEIENDGDCGELVSMLKGNMNYGRLGSLGPDLPYFNGVLRTAASFLLAGSYQPEPIERWGDLLHSKKPNVFPLTMMEIAWRETDPDEEEWDVIAQNQWAFIMGYVTHIAADQIIHPYVNKIAGNYYRDKEKRKKHLDCEVYQDVVVFSNRYNKSILDEHLDTWVNIHTKSGKTEPHFRRFLQKSFKETHAIFPSENDIEHWYRGLSFIQKWLKWIGLPYKKADTDFRTKGETSEKYKEFCLDTPLAAGKSYEDYYRDAVQLSSLYIRAAGKFYGINHAGFKDELRTQFLAIVRNADLRNPLDNNILEDAQCAYSAYYGR
jgi:hypothetical protein